MIVLCDFPHLPNEDPYFHPERWNQRTCPRCRSKGLPDQSTMTWSAYEQAAKRANARKRKMASRQPVDRKGVRRSAAKRKNRRSP